MKQESHTQFTVDRDNDKPLRFSGEQIARHSVNLERYKTCCRVFKTKGGKFVVSLEYWNHDTEERMDKAAVFETAEQVMAYLEKEKPSFAYDIREQLDLFEDIA